MTPIGGFTPLYDTLNHMQDMPGSCFEWRLRVGVCLNWFPFFPVSAQICSFGCDDELGMAGARFRSGPANSSDQELAKPCYKWRAKPSQACGYLGAIPSRRLIGASGCRRLGASDRTAQNSRKGSCSSLSAPTSNTEIRTNIQIKTHGTLKEDFCLKPIPLK